MTGRRYKIVDPGLDQVNENSPYYVRRVGTEWQVSGVLFQGMGDDILMLSHVADLPDGNLTIIRPTLEEWELIVKLSDNPEHFRDQEFMKGIVGKQKYLMSGFVQQKTWARDSFMCLYCGWKMGDVQLSVDHFVPLFMGGANNIDNYVSACRRCNKDKGNIDPVKYCSDHGMIYQEFVDYLSGKIGVTDFSHL